MSSSSPTPQQQQPRYVVDWGKLWTLTLVIVSTMTLCLAEKVSGEVVVGVVLLVTGYTAGNGVQARRRQSPQPLIGAAGDRRTTDDEAGS